MTWTTSTLPHQWHCPVIGCTWFIKWSDDERYADVDEGVEASVERHEREHGVTS